MAIPCGLRGPKALAPPSDRGWRPLAGTGPGPSSWTGGRKSGAFTRVLVSSCPLAWHWKSASTQRRGSRSGSGRMMTSDAVWGAGLAASTPTGVPVAGQEGFVGPSYTGAVPPPNPILTFRGLIIACTACVALSGAGVAGMRWLLQNMEMLSRVREVLMQNVMGRSTIPASFALVLASGICDKTFFVTALLAMRVGRAISFAGSMLALSSMTVISVGIGYLLTKVPVSMPMTEFLGQLLSAALLFYFGIMSLQAAAVKPSVPQRDHAESSFAVAVSGGRLQPVIPGGTLVLEIAGLIFAAEWGDRSMLAVVALAASRPPVAVALGAAMGHAVATLLAVLAGAALAKRADERSMGLLGGSLFILFALATLVDLALLKTPH